MRGAQARRIRVTSTPSHSLERSTARTAPPSSVSFPLASCLDDMMQSRLGRRHTTAPCMPWLTARTPSPHQARHGGRTQNTYHLPRRGLELMHEALRELLRSQDARVHESFFFLRVQQRALDHVIEYSPPTTFSSAAGDAGENTTRYVHVRQAHRVEVSTCSGKPTCHNVG